MKLEVINCGILPGTEQFSNGVEGVNLLDSNAVSYQRSRADSLVYPQELTQITNLKIREVYRPLKWRQYIQVEPVASWAQRIEDRKIAAQMEDPTLASNKGPTHSIPVPSFSTSNQFLPVYEFLVGYGVTDRDIELAGKIGFGLIEENIRAVTLAVENFLEKIASVGLTNPSLKGLGNLADFSTATAVNKGSNQSATPWTGTGDDAPTQDQLFQDVMNVYNTMATQTLENQECNLILVPLLQKQALSKVSSSTFERSALARLKAELPEVQIKVWDKLKTSGSSSTPCAIGLDTTDPFGPRMLMQKELTFGQPLRGINGYIIPGKVSTGGVRAINPTGVIKMSGL